ncbi:MAG: hypothetical protein ACRYGR_02810 [Janthinobacterium lividum]
MNSSVNSTPKNSTNLLTDSTAPQGDFKRFTFGQVFAGEQELKRRQDCIYQEDDMQAAKLASHSQGEQVGYLRGRQEAEASLLRQCADLIAHHLQELILSQKRLEANAHQGVAQLTLDVLQTLLPTYAHQGAQQEVTEIIREAFQTIETSKMVIYVHPDLKDFLEKDLENLLTSVGRDIDVSLQTSTRLNENFDLSDCRIEWQGGDLSVAKAV